MGFGVAQEFWTSWLVAAEGLGVEECMLGLALLGLYAVRQLRLGTLAATTHWIE